MAVLPDSQMPFWGYFSGVFTMDGLTQSLATAAIDYGLINSIFAEN